MVNKSIANNNGGNTGKNGGSGYKGVRMRKWGKWVSEIRVSKSRERIWLGSYETAEKAAKAYDAAVFCMRGGGVGKLYNLNFPQNRPALETLLSSYASSSSLSSTTVSCNRFPSYLTRSQIQLVASKYANITSDVATMAPAVPINSPVMSSALHAADALAFPTNSLDLSSALPTNSLDMSSALPVANANSMLLCQGEKVLAPSPMEMSVVENWHANSSNCNDGLGFDQFYGGDCHAAMEKHISPVVAAVEGQGGNGFLEDAIAPHGTSGGGESSRCDVLYQSSAPDDPYYCWTYR
ncbi:ethylene-responsive transcription factor ERF043-like [Papaver somniferum]|uniref:ethylene-responsive transcription factor ERF043-like n=1 Tax=Papaver somniferum TaxID=3469 RepID=UPI000E6F7593|nr:ethylene-responsive transcription factor ERF043-like [Papaver somniferum]